jgi:hypothetical protein
MEMGMKVTTKRRNPFGEEMYRENKNIKNDMETIYGSKVILIVIA